MVERPPIRFFVPVDGTSLAVRAFRGLMADRCEGLHSFTVESEHFDAGALHEACKLVNKLIDAGMPWSDLATFRNNPGTIAALVESAHNRLIELQWAERSDGHAA